MGGRRGKMRVITHRPGVPADRGGANHYLLRSCDLYRLWKELLREILD